MSKVIKMKLSQSSVKEAIRQLNDYQNDLKRKTSLFVQRLAEVGIVTIDKHKYSQGTSDFNDLRTYVWLEEQGDWARATLVLSGKDVAFIEFGAGVHYNGSVGQSPNPFGQQHGMTIGSYGKGQGAKDSWVFFDEELGRFRSSHGTKAAMPMYYADKEIIDQVQTIAREVFGNG